MKQKLFLARREFLSHSLSLVDNILKTDKNDSARFLQTDRYSLGEDLIPIAVHKSLLYGFFETLDRLYRSFTVARIYCDFLYLRLRVSRAKIVAISQQFLIYYESFLCPACSVCALATLGRG